VYSKVGDDNIDLRGGDDFADAGLMAGTLWR
jgi:hypothetical protein